MERKHPLRIAREERNLTLNELAEKSGVSAVSITNIEHGKITNPRLSTKQALSKALLIPIPKLFPIEESIPAPFPTSRAEKSKADPDEETPTPITLMQQRIKSECEKISKEVKAYELLIQGFKILADLADQQGPGQAAMYRIKIDGYTKAADQSRRALAKLDEILA